MLKLGFARTVEVFCVIELRAADHLPLQEGFVAVALRTHQAQVGLRGRHLSAGGFQLQANVLGVQFGQRLVGLDPLAFIHPPFSDLAANTKGQLRVKAGTDFAGITLGGHCRRLRLHHDGGADAHLNRLLMPARS